MDRIGAEAARPQAMAEHDDLFFAGFVLGGRERPAERRLHAEDVEVAGRDAGARHALRGSLVREVEARILRGGELAERRRARAGVGEVAGRDAARPALIVLVDIDEPIGRGIRQRLQHDGVHRAEDRRGGADADREREQRDQRETRLRDEVPHGERDVLGELRPVFRPSHVVVLLAAERPAGGVDLVDVAEAADGRRAGRGRVHAPRHELARPHLDVKRELGVDFVLDPGLPQARSEPLPERHLPASSIFDTPAAKRAHCCVSACSRRRPSPVIR